MSDITVQSIEPDETAPAPTDSNEGIVQADPPNKAKATVVPLIVTRVWNDVEPKVAAGLLGGSISAALIAEAANIGFPLNPGAAALLTALLSFVGGYLKTSTAKTTFEGSIKN